MKLEEADYNTAFLTHLSGLITEKADPALVAMVAGKLNKFLTTVGSSAKRATGADGKPILRWQDRLIEKLVEEGASVLDLGCGNGELLARLSEIKQIQAQGIELDPEAVLACIENGIDVFHSNLDEGLKGFPADSFDYVILEETLQMLHRPAEVLAEMLRVGKRGVVTFPNFAYWRVRLDLAIRGRMPVTEWLPYSWHNTPNIHLLTLQDFMEYTEENGMRVSDGHALVEGTVRPLQEGDNLYAEEVLLIIESA
ncbi:MAG: methionine biosynthesis protein MetW [Planctomycetota bacterium]|jgi:methionine biosynthesis protein MetW